jgi:hypothetical protein
MMSKVTNPGDNLISLPEAIEMTTCYRENKDSILDPTVSPSVLPICETFGVADLQAVIDQTGCEKIRVYFGMKAGKNISVLAVGVNSDDEDMISTVNRSYTNIILDNGSRCPMDCPPKSDLN